MIWKRNFKLRAGVGEKLNKKLRSKLSSPSRVELIRIFDKCKYFVKVILFVYFLGLCWKNGTFMQCAAARGERRVPNK